MQSICRRNDYSIAATLFTLSKEVAKFPSCHFPALTIFLTVLLRPIPSGSDLLKHTLNVLSWKRQLLNALLRLNGGFDLLLSVLERALLLGPMELLGVLSPTIMWFCLVGLQMYRAVFIVSDIMHSVERDRYRISMIINFRFVLWVHFKNSHCPSASDMIVITSQSILKVNQI